MIGTNRMGDKAGSIGSVTKEETRRVIDEDGFELDRTCRRLGNYMPMPEIFAVGGFIKGVSPSLTSSTRLPGATQD